MLSGLPSGFAEPQFQVFVAKRSGVLTSGVAAGHAVAWAEQQGLSGLRPWSHTGCEARPCLCGLLPVRGSGVGSPRTYCARRLGVVSGIRRPHRSRYLSSRQSCRVFEKAHVVGNRLPPRPRDRAGLCTFPGPTVWAPAPGKLLAGVRCLVALEGCQPLLPARPVWQGDAGAPVRHGPAPGAPVACGVLLLSRLPGCLGPLLVASLQPP